MVLWGAIWGGILGAMWPGYGGEWRTVLGALFGLVAGLTLRAAIRTEIKSQLSKLPKPATVSAPVATPVIGQAVVPPPIVPVPAAAQTGPVELMHDEPPAQAASTAPPVKPFEPDFADTAPPAALEPIRSVAPSRPPAPPREPDIFEQLIGKARGWLFGGNTVVRMGVLVLFVGLAFLAKFAIDNSLLPPELRLAAIGAAGIALFVVGFRLRAKGGKLGYALTLQGAGVGVLYLTVFAAFRLYQFLPSGAAFVALGLICAFAAVIALMQNALPMAFIGFAGGFAAPILVSTGQGNHVGLFSYYLLLSVAIAAIAWARAWRPLNLLGFFATFGVATAWGVLKYQPAQFSSTEPFLIAFFVVYLAATVMYALRHSLAARRAVDATLVFGLPIVAFGLQAGLVHDMPYASAFSSLALGALYLVLGWWLARRKGGADETSRWLAECFAALGLGFVTLAVPLALDGRWTSAVWAVEGAGVYWMGRRQGRWLARAAGLALQVLAAMLYLDGVDSSGTSRDLIAFANPAFMGAVMLFGAALAMAWWSRTAMSRLEGESINNSIGNSIGNVFINIENLLSPVLFWIGFLWLQFALSTEINRAPINAESFAQPVYGAELRQHLQLLAWVGAAFVFHLLALPLRARPWPIAATPAWTVMPVLLAGAVAEASSMNHVFMSGGWVVWPLLLVMHFVMLRNLDKVTPQAWWPWVHAGGVWLVVLLIGNALVFAIGRAQLWQTAWATVILLVSGTVVLLALSARAGFERTFAGWPLARFARSYFFIAAAPLAVMVALGALMVALLSDGNAKPLPYVPLLNPTDLSVAMALGACALWLARVRGATVLEVPAAVRSRKWLLVLAGIVFVAINTMWLRVAHHFGGVPWDADRLFASFLVQAGYSILWTVMALVLMVVAFRRGWRGAWMLGAGLLGVTVLKLFVIDLSNRGGSERIFVFIAVGLLMLVVGYFAPIPPAAKAEPGDTVKGNV